MLLKKLIIQVIAKIGIIFSDAAYLRIMYYLEMGKILHLDSPKGYQEKLQWLKIHNRKAVYTKMVDKVEAKKYVSSIIGDEYIIPTLGVWDSFDEIDFNKLPNQFVLKTNNGGGNCGVIICTDKTKLNKKKARIKLKKSLKSSIYKRYREWPYKNVNPKIFAEQYMIDKSDINKGGLSDYKFTCFNGDADNVMVCLDRQSGSPKFYFFDREWHLMPLNVRGKNTDPSFKLPKPACMDEMFQIAGKLSEGLPFARVDLYCVNNRPYFGEITFYPASGFDPNILPETEKYFGDKIDLCIM